MDMRTGEIYPTREEALEAGVPASRLTNIRSTADTKADPFVCERCGDRVRNRRSTPRKAGSDGTVRYWCKPCWKKLGNYG